MTETTVILTYYGFILVAFLMGAGVGALGMAFYVMSVFDKQSAESIKEMGKALEDYNRGEGWKKAKEEQDKDDDNWLKKQLGG